MAAGTGAGEAEKRALMEGTAPPGGLRRILGTAELHT